MDQNPVSTILHIVGGCCLPRCLHVVAELGVAEALDEKPLTAQAGFVLEREIDTGADISIREAKLA